jgi:hypothetical protein
MARLVEPSLGDRLILGCRQADLNGEDRLHQILFAQLGHGRLVPVGDGGEGRLLAQGRILGHHLSDPLHREGELEIDRLLGPQGAVVVEHRDPFGRRHEVGARARHPRHSR